MTLSSQTIHMMKPRGMLREGCLFLLLAALVPVVHCGELRLHGSNSAITFGGERAARLTASCSDNWPGAVALGPNNFTGWAKTHRVRVKFINVPPSCVDVPLSTPCANDSAIDPKLWWYVPLPHRVGARPS